jgi:mono/diheme cytochrome c family protein
MRLRKHFIVVLTVLVLLVPATSVAYAQDPDAGKATFEQLWQCQNCHGPDGKGLYGRPLAGSEKTAQEWINQVRNPARGMPAFSAEQVTDQQITDLQAYFAAQAKPADFAPKLPPESADPGQNLMLQKRCVACHTSEAETGQGQLIDGFVQRGVTPTAEVVLKQLRTPFKNMPSFRPDQVSDADAALIADFLAAQVAVAAPPAALPQSGGDSPAQWPLVLLAAGSVLAAAGYGLRRFLVKPIR